MSCDVCGDLLKSVAASDHLKGWIRDALGRRADRFVEASEALAVLRETKIEPAKPPRSLEGQHVVFTGTLRQRRVDVQAAARRAGAVVQNKVNGATSVVIAGEPNPLQIGQKAGTKLFDAQRRIQRGQAIAIIDEARFHRLARR
jgi:NAD-dependent DNA ligase